MKVFRYILSATVTLLSFASCIEGERASNDPADVFQKLWEIIDQRYCFLDYKEQELGVRWEDAYARHKARITKKMGNAALFEVLCDMLGELKDGHVNLYSSADLGRNWSWREDFPKNLDEELRESYLGTGNDYRIASGIKYRILPENIGYMVCESFSSTISESGLNEILYYLRSCNGLILDVRGNSGGNLTSAEALSQRFTNERLLVGYFCHKTGPAHNDFSSLEAEYLEPSNGIRWQKPCIVLTNRSCYSATNAFVRNMKECPLVTVLGDQTGGGSGLPFIYELPNGWWVRLSACPMFDAKKQHVEFGIQPDIVCHLDSIDVGKGKDTMIEEAIMCINKVSP